jgi:hypothetical protein
MVKTTFLTDKSRLLSSRQPTLLSNEKVEIHIEGKEQRRGKDNDRREFWHD